MSLIPFGFWAASGGGAAGAYDLLETTTLATSASSVTFSGLGSYSDYAHLQIRMLARSTESFSGGYFQFTANGDSGSNYSSHDLSGNGSAVSSAAFSSQSSMRLGSCVGSLAPTGQFPASVIDILDFSSTSKAKTFRSLNGFDYSSSQAKIRLQSGLWQSTSAITSIGLTCFGYDLSVGSRFSLFGIKAN